jgi:ACS family D-galactonate transporter-like MFS transporter
MATAGVPAGGASLPARGGKGWLRRLWDRELAHYPDAGARAWYLGLTVLVTLVFYYQQFAPPTIGPAIVTHFQFTFAQINYVSAIGLVLGAFASLAAGLADRWGRTRLVVGGLLLSSLILLVLMPAATNKVEWIAFGTLLGIVEGAAVVATPALIRDLSPQLGRGTAMGFWTLGPVLGSLVATEVASHVLTSHHSWAFVIRLAGIVGLVVWVIALFGLRELSPQLRDQLMVSIRDRELIEARAAEIDPDKALKHHWKQVLKLDVIGPSLGVALFLLVYLSFVALLVGYFQTVFGYTSARANGVANWYWIADAIAVISAGLLADALRVRKPLIVVGGAVALIGTVLFAVAATERGTSYDTFVLYSVLMAGGGGVAYVAWMTAFTETVERHNPAATATGLAVWGWIGRMVATGMFVAVAVILAAMTPLLDHGPRIKQIVATYPEQVKVLQTVDPATLATLSKNPNDAAAQARAVSQLSGLPIATVAKTAALTSAQQLGKAPPAAALAFLAVNGPKVKRAAGQLQSVGSIPADDIAFLSAHGPAVAQAQKDNPSQWQTWWWICVAGQVVFLPLALLLKGRWRPSRARQDEREHDQAVQRQLADLRGVAT